MISEHTPPIYLDLGDFEEDQRIETIGRTVLEQHKTVAFVTDADPGKADRYIRKLTERFPGLRVLGRFDGPVPDTVTIQVGPPEGVTR